MKDVELLFFGFFHFSTCFNVFFAILQGDRSGFPWKNIARQAAQQMGKTLHEIAKLLTDSPRLGFSRSSPLPTREQEEDEITGPWPWGHGLKGGVFVGPGAWGRVRNALCRRFRTDPPTDRSSPQRIRGCDRQTCSRLRSYLFSQKPLTAMTDVFIVEHRHGLFFKARAC